ncbi:MAG: hypothetical protein ACLQBK_08600 [Candidatus Sulfotelmatobacter sp.]
MTSIRKFVYTALLALSALSFAPSLATAQGPAQGQFTLSHDVRWENAVVPAGDYKFSFLSDGIAVLRLSKLSGRRTDFMFLVRDTDDARPSELNQLVLEKTSEGSYVSAMNLPEFGMTLHFRVPSHVGERQVAKATTAPPAAMQ